MQDESVDGSQPAEATATAPARATGDASTGAAHHLLSTKLARPRVPPTYVARTQVAERLDAGTTGPLTVVSAGAGWGKTLTTAAWAAGSPGIGPVAWLSVDDGDNEPRSFWNYVLAALRGVLTLPPGNAIAGLDPALGCEEENLRRLAAGIAELPAPVVLVIDDFHLLHEPAVLEGVAALLRHPPRQLRLVLLTRADPALPLHRLRVNDELAEIRARDLAFSATEAARLFAADGVPVPPDQAELLVRRTEGWPAGLRLAALFLRRDGHQRSAEEFAGDDRAVTDYLVEEVLASQPPDLRRFLMRTSVAERVSSGLAEVLTGYPRCQSVLETLERTNAFVVGLGSDRRWFRYHPLLREMLQHQLSLSEPDTLSGLHRRAALWFADSEAPVEALRHALAAEDWELFGRLFVTHAAPLLVSTERMAVGRLLEAVPPQRSTDSAELALCAAGRLYHAGRFPEMQHHLDFADARLAESPSGAATGSRIAARAFTAAVARTRGDMPALVSAAAAALELLAGPGLGLPAADDYRAIALSNRGAGELWSGLLGDAERHLRDALTAVADTRLEVTRINVLGHLALTAVATGRLREGFTCASTAVELVAARGWVPLPQAASAYLAVGLVHFEWNNVDLARRLLTQGRGDGVDLAPDFAMTLAQARIEASLDRVDVAREELARLRRRLPDWTPPAYLAGWLVVTEAEVDLAAGDPATALTRFPPVAAEAMPTHQRVCLAKVLLAAGEPQRADRVLAGLRTGGEPNGDDVETWLVTALLADRLREDNRALDALQRAIVLARPERVRRPFAALGHEHLPRLLTRLHQVDSAFGELADEVLGDVWESAPPSLPLDPLADPLTDRELSVLRQLPTMMTNVEIAGELYVSVNTVKAHLKRLYRKLGVVSRRDAVHRARELGLLHD